MDDAWVEHGNVDQTIGVRIDPFILTSIHISPRHQTSPFLSLLYFIFISETSIVAAHPTHLQRRYTQRAQRSTLYPLSAYLLHHTDRHHVLSRHSLDRKVTGRDDGFSSNPIRRLTTHVSSDGAV